MKLQSSQLARLGQSAQSDFLSRLDALLLPHSAPYAEAPPERRLAVLAQVMEEARSNGIREELNIGLYALWVLLFGEGLQTPEVQSILTDPHREGPAKIFQLWTWCRQQWPDAPVFASANATAR